MRFRPLPPRCEPSSGQMLHNLSSVSHGMGPILLLLCSFTGLAHSYLVPSEDVHVLRPRQPDTGPVLHSPRSPYPVALEKRAAETFDLGWQVQDQPLFSAFVLRDSLYRRTYREYQDRITDEMSIVTGLVGRAISLLALPLSRPLLLSRFLSSSNVSTAAPTGASRLPSTMATTAGF